MTLDEGATHGSTVPLHAFEDFVNRLTVDRGGIIRGPRNQRELALVFAGGLFSEGAKTILDTLRERHLAASFFLTGDFLQVQRHRRLVERIVADGHYLGPHSHRHLLYCAWDNCSTTLVTRDEFVTDLDRNLADLSTYGPNRDEMRFWLPPYEWYNRTIASWSREQNMTLFNFTPGTRSHTDWAPRHHRAFVPSRVIVQGILDHEQRDPDGLNGFLLLMHLGAGPERADKLHRFLAPLLDILADRGYRFERIDVLLKDAAKRGPER